MTEDDDRLPDRFAAAVLKAVKEAVTARDREWAHAIHSAMEALPTGPDHRIYPCVPEWEAVYQALKWLVEAERAACATIAEEVVRTTIEVPEGPTGVYAEIESEAARSPRGIAAAIRARGEGSP